MTDVRVLIVDDQTPFREASKMVVEMTDGFEVVGRPRTVSRPSRWRPTCGQTSC